MCVYIYIYIYIRIHIHIHSELRIGSMSFLFKPGFRHMIIVIITCVAFALFVCCVEANTTKYTRGPDSHAELIPVQSPLLRESYLVVFPPLTYMLTGTEEHGLLEQKSMACLNRRASLSAFLHLLEQKSMAAPTRPAPRAANNKYYFPGDIRWFAGDIR